MHMAILVALLLMMTGWLPVQHLLMAAGVGVSALHQARLTCLSSFAFHERAKVQISKKSTFWTF